jgi:hypothetical protein
MRCRQRHRAQQGLAGRPPYLAGGGEAEFEVGDADGHHGVDNAILVAPAVDLGNGRDMKAESHEDPAGARQAALAGLVERLDQFLFVQPAHPPCRVGNGHLADAQPGARFAALDRGDQSFRRRLVDEAQRSRGRRGRAARITG